MQHELILTVLKSDAARYATPPASPSPTLAPTFFFFFFLAPLSTSTLDGVASGKPSSPVAASFDSPIVSAACSTAIRFTPRAATSIPSLVNIDAQSLVFDDSTLFEWSKFSGYDRFETGTRLNYGGQATTVVAGSYGMTATLDVLEALANGQGPTQAILALGYSGWGPGQLESEIARNDWLTGEASEARLLEFARQLGCPTKSQLDARLNGG